VTLRLGIVSTDRDSMPILVHNLVELIDVLGTGGRRAGYLAVGGMTERKMRDTGRC
jgi:hypothetical protein